MRLKSEQIDRLAEKIFADLTAAKLIILKGERKEILASIKGVIAADIRREEDLEKEADRLLEENLRAIGGGQGIDRHKMLKMIKEKLARERNIVL